MRANGVVLDHQPAAVEACRRCDPRRHRGCGPHGEGSAHAIALRADAAPGVDAGLPVEPADQCAGIAHDRLGGEPAAPRPDLAEAATGTEGGEVLELLSRDISVIRIDHQHRIAALGEPPRHHPEGVAQAGDIGPHHHRRMATAGGVNEEGIGLAIGGGDRYRAFGQPAGTAEYRLAHTAAIHPGASGQRRGAAQHGELSPVEAGQVPSVEFTVLAHRHSPSGVVSRQRRPLSPA